MEFRQLRYFLAVAELNSYRRASEKLHVVQPAVSVQVRALEEELGVSLFTRTSRQLSLTQAGVLFKVEAERTLEQAERARSTAQRAALGLVGSVRIGFAGNAAVTGKLPEDLNRFHRDFPDVALELRELAPAAQAEAINSGQLDLGYSHAFGSSYEFDLATDVLASWPWVVAMAHDHPLASSARIATSDLKEHEFILYARSGADVGQLMTLRRLLDREPRIAYRVDSTLTVFSLVSAGLGLALIPTSLTKIGIPNLIFRELQDFTEPTSLILLSREQEVSPAVVNFRALVCNLKGS